MTSVVEMKGLGVDTSLPIPHPPKSSSSVEFQQHLREDEQEDDSKKKKENKRRVKKAVRIRRSHLFNRFYLLVTHLQIQHRQRW